MANDQMVIDSSMNNGTIQALFSGLSSTLVYAIIGSALIGGAGRLYEPIATMTDNAVETIGFYTSYVGLPFDWLADKLEV